MSILPNQVVYQVVYLNSEGLPEFLDLRAGNEEEARAEAAEWVRGQKESLCTNNFQVTLIKIIQEFRLDRS